MNILENKSNYYPDIEESPSSPETSYALTVRGEEVLSFIMLAEELSLMSTIDDLVSWAS